MAKFCTKCGAQLDDNAQFCPSCGAKYEPQQQAQPQGQPNQQWQQPNQQQGQPNQQWQQPPQGQPGQQQWQQPPRAQRPPQATDHTAMFHPNDIGYNKGYSVLSYLGLLCLIPYLSQRGKTSPYTRFHATQGMYMMVCEIAISIICGLLSLIKVPQTIDFGFGAIPTGIMVTAWPVALIIWLVEITMLVFEIIGIVWAATGKAKDMPLFSKMRKLNWFK